MTNENPEFQPAPFAFQQAPEGEQPAETPANGRRKRGPRRKAQTAEVVDMPKRGRPRRTAAEPAKLRPKKARKFKVELSMALEACAGLQPDDVKLLTGMVQVLNDMSKASRKRIIGALGRIFT